MKELRLYENWVFHDENPYAEPLLVDHEKRVLRFTLRPGQIVKEHVAPGSPVHIIILQGTGIFTGDDGIEHPQGQGKMLIFDSGEKHSIRALDEELVFLAILHGAPGALA
jgi:quercetin dioxygenase-like cupin family protein